GHQLGEWDYLEAALSQAEQLVAADGAGITAFRSSKSHRPRRPVSFAFGGAAVTTALPATKATKDRMGEPPLVAVFGSATQPHGPRDAAQGGCMRLTLLIPCLLAGGLAGSLPRAGTEEKPAPVSLSYAHAGLTEITVEGGKLCYVWHTLRQRDGEETARRG